MWQQWAALAAVPVGLALAAFVAPALRRTLGSLAGAAAVGVVTGALVFVVSDVAFAALVVGAMAFAFALIGSGGAGRWVSRAAAPQGVKGSAGERGGASGSW